MRRVLLSCGTVVFVSWLSAHEGVEVRHSCVGRREHVSPIVKVLEAPAGRDNKLPGSGSSRPAVLPKRGAA